MSAEIIHKGSGVQGNTPLSTDLALREFGINYNANDPAVYIKDSDGNIRRVAGKASTLSPGAVQLTSELDVFSEELAPTALALAEVNSKIENFKDAFRYDKRLYVTEDGNDSANGSSPAEALRSLRRACELAQPGTAIILGAGEYIEVCPIAVRRNVGIFGDALRQVTIRPTPATRFEGFFLVDSGFYCFGCTFTGHQQGTDAGIFKIGWVVQFDATANNLALGATGFGAYITRSPYMQNCTSLTARQDDGQGGSVSTGLTGGGLLVDGAACAPNSPLRSMVVDSFTQVNLGGPGCLIKNDGFAQLVSFFSTFCEYHIRCESGGQASVSSSTTNFGIFSLIADGFSPSPLFTGSADGSTISSVNVVNISQPRFGFQARPLPGLLMRIGSEFYTVTGSVPLSDGRTGFRVNFFPALTAGVPAGTTLDFVRRSQISTGGHNMEYVGAGTNYLALPENGGVPIPANEVVEINRGRVFFISFDQLGNLRVGKGFDVDGATGNVTISTDNFNLAGLNFIGPFKRDGIFFGEQLREVSNNTDLLSSFTGTPDGNTVPTQFAVKTYVDDKFQEKLVSTENIKNLISGGNTTGILGPGSVNFKTINGQTLLGAGNISILGGGGGEGGSAARSEIIFNTEDGAPPTLAVSANAENTAFVINGDLNPTLTLVRGRTYTFTVASTDNPFWIKTSRSLGTSDAFTTGVTNNGITNGTLLFSVPLNAPDILFYQSQFFAPVGGTFSIVDEGEAEGLVELPKSGFILRITTSKPGWFRLYNRSEALVADASRTRDIDPLPGSGVLTELITTPAQGTLTLSPSAIIANMEVPSSNEYFYRFTNDGTPGTTQISIQFLIIEG
jgi:hypothetical protein